MVKKVPSSILPAGALWKSLFYIIPILFLIRLLSSWEWVNLGDWQKRACWLEFSQHVPPQISMKSESDCLFPRKQSFLFALPVSNYGQSVECSIGEVPKDKKEVCESSAGQGYWATLRPQKIPSIGWDAYSVWYTRAAAIYFWSKKESWPGLFAALGDSQFISSFPSTEHIRYPWLVPVFYSALMRLWDSPHPLPLQIVQLCIYALTVLLFWKTWPKARTELKYLFAFAPIGAGFLFSLYADVFLLLASLSVVWCWQNQRAVLLAVILALGVWIKSEAYVQFALLIFVLFLSQRPQNKTMYFALLALMVSYLFYRQWSLQWPNTYWFSITSRLAEVQTYTQRIPKILGYFLDVLFRPGLWVVLWPFSIWQFYKHRKILGFRILSVAALLVLIPVAYLAIPDGSFKETVLTGSNRALWQALPLLWVLLKQCQNPQLEQS